METDEEQFDSYSSYSWGIQLGDSDRDEEELESPVEFIEEDSEVEVDLGEMAEYVDNEEIHVHFGGYEYEFVDMRCYLVKNVRCASCP